MVAHFEDGALVRALQEALDDGAGFVLGGGYRAEVWNGCDYGADAFEGLGLLDGRDVDEGGAVALGGAFVDYGADFFWVAVYLRLGISIYVACKVRLEEILTR